MYKFGRIVPIFYVGIVLRRIIIENIGSQVPVSKEKRRGATTRARTLANTSENLSNKTEASTSHIFLTQESPVWMQSKHDIQ